MEDKELIELLKKEVPVDLLTESQREEAKKQSKLSVVMCVKYINDITNAGLKISKTYYDLYISEQSYE